MEVNGSELKKEDSSLSLGPFSTSGKKKGYALFMRAVPSVKGKTLLQACNSLQ